MDFTNGLSLLIMLYLIVVNVISFTMFGIDKSAARAKRRRISEKQLFLISVIGGALGSWAGMRVWRHKTLHTSFRLGIPLLVAANTICLMLIYKIAGL